MSRSYKKNPIFGYTGNSEKSDKKNWHQSFRKKTKDIIQKSHYDIDELEDTIFPTEHDITNIATMSKDGKHYWNPKKVPASILEYFKKMMRK